MSLVLCLEIKERDEREEREKRKETRYPALWAILDSWHDPSPAGDLGVFPI